MSDSARDSAVSASASASVADSGDASSTAPAATLAAGSMLTSGRRKAWTSDSAVSVAMPPTGSSKTKSAPLSRPMQQRSMRRG